MTTELMEPVRKSVVVADAVDTQQSGWMRLIEKMLDKGTPIDQLKILFDIYEAGERKMAEKAFLADFAAFKAEAPPSIERTGRVGYDSKKTQEKVKYGHAELDVGCNTLVPFLSKNNLSHSWQPVQDPKTGQISVTCRLDHRDGFSRSVTLSGPPDASGSKNPLQAINSTVTYLERYTFFAVTGTAQAGGDDDGRGGAEAVIDKEQIGQINDLLEVCRSAGKPINLDRFCNFVREGCQSIGDFTQSDHKKAMTELTAKARSAKAGAK